MGRFIKDDILDPASRFLDGVILIAMPAMADPRFERSIIYLCAHSEDGAMGIIVNQHAPHIKFDELLEQLNITPSDNPISMPQIDYSTAVHVGGPVETGRGFVLHSSDYYAEDSTLPIDEGVFLTATLDILRAMAYGKGPDQALLALGYAGWAPGQASRARFAPMAGCTVPPIRASFLIRTSTSSTTAHWPRLALIPPTS